MMRSFVVHLLSTATSHIQEILSSRFFTLMFIIPPAVSFLVLILLGIYYRNLPLQVPLYYSRPWGEEQLAHPIFLFILPLGNLFFYAISMVFISTTMYQYRIFAHMLLFSSVILTFFSSFIIFNVIRLVL